MKHQLPGFDVSHRGKREGLLVGRVSAQTVGEETWVGDRHLGYLLDGEALTPGRWQRVGGDWGFMPAAGHADSSRPDVAKYSVLDSYWGQLAGIVLDRTDRWTPATWSDPVDHDHCALCWTTIDAGNPQHWRNAAGRVVCPGCHERYVEAGSLDLIEPHRRMGPSDE